MPDETLALLAPRAGRGLLRRARSAAAVTPSASCGRARPTGGSSGSIAIPTALAAAGARLAPFGERVTLVHGAFGDVRAILAAARASAPIDGFVLDLGVSSPQLDRGERGFSLPQRRAARHAHGSDRRARRAEGLHPARRHRRAGRHPAPLRRGALRRAHRARDQGGGRWPARSRPRPSWRRSSRETVPTPRAAQGSGDAHVSGAAHRGQRRARAARALPGRFPVAADGREGAWW